MNGKLKMPKLGPVAIYGLAMIGTLVAFVAILSLTGDSDDSGGSAARNSELVDILDAHQDRGCRGSINRHRLLIVAELDEEDCLNSAVDAMRDLDIPVPPSDDGLLGTHQGLHFNVTVEAATDPLGAVFTFRER